MPWHDVVCSLGWVWSTGTSLLFSDQERSEVFLPPNNPTSGVNPKKLKAGSSRHNHTPIFITALSITAIGVSGPRTGHPALFHGDLVIISNCSYLGGSRSRTGPDSPLCP